MASLAYRSVSSVDLAFGFTGKWTEEDTGYRHHLNRWFDPEIGKWISEDPIGFAGGDFNISRYVANRPLRLIDTLGLDFGVLPITTGAGSGDELFKPENLDGDFGEYSALSLAPPAFKITVKLTKNYYGGDGAVFSLLNPIWFGAWKVNEQFSEDSFQAAEGGLQGTITQGVNNLKTLEDFTQTGMAGTVADFFDTYINDGSWTDFGMNGVFSLFPSSKGKKPSGTKSKNDLGSTGTQCFVAGTEVVMAPATLSSMIVDADNPVPVSKASLGAIAVGGVLSWLPVLSRRHDAGSLAKNKKS